MPSCPSGYVEKTNLFGFRTQCVRTRKVRSQRRATASTKKSRPKVYIPSIKSLARKACPPGMVERKGYKRKYSNSIRKRGFTVKRSGTTYRVYPKEQSASVAAACVKDTGAAGPKSIGPLRKGELTKYGYSWRQPTEKRHTALNKAIKVYGPLGVFRKLDAIYKLSEHKISRVAEVFKADRNWVYGKYKSVQNVVQKS